MVRDRFLIRVSNMDADEVAVDTLTHEFAHILSWKSEHYHGVDFGRAYAKVYEVYEKWVAHYNSELKKA